MLYPVCTLRAIVTASYVSSCAPCQSHRLKHVEEIAARSLIGARTLFYHGKITVKLTQYASCYSGLFLYLSGTSILPPACTHGVMATVILYLIPSSM